MGGKGVPEPDPWKEITDISVQMLILNYGDARICFRTLERKSGKKDRKRQGEHSKMKCFYPDQKGTHKDEWLHSNREASFPF
ncbi:hypothetical protein TNCV_2003151 [Trichonephila clavipes]|nr:hypothetical protein TNCV_2003151 [Trichonephila clavipes]